MGLYLTLLEQTTVVTARLTVVLNSLLHIIPHIIVAFRFVEYFRRLVFRVNV